MPGIWQRPDGGLKPKTHNNWACITHLWRSREGTAERLGPPQGSRAPPGTQGDKGCSCQVCLTVPPNATQAYFLSQPPPLTLAGAE